MTADNFLLSDTHHDESTVCQVKSILIQLTVVRQPRRLPAVLSVEEVTLLLQAAP